MGGDVEGDVYGRGPWSSGSRQFIGLHDLVGENIGSQGIPDSLGDRLKEVRNIIPAVDAELL
jgi:hypothetical protein